MKIFPLSHTQDTRKEENPLQQHTHNPIVFNLNDSNVAHTFSQDNIVAPVAHLHSHPLITASSFPFFSASHPPFLPLPTNILLCMGVGVCVLIALFQAVVTAE